MAHLPTGVTVVTAPGSDGPTGATANAVTSLSLEPPLVLACLDRGSRTLAAVRAAGRFGVNVLRSEHAEMARAFSTKAAHVEKWADVAWTDRERVPIIDDALLWFACGLGDVHEGGDHVILTGTLLALGGDGEGDPLVFHRGEYRGLG
jgi:3-hydroxy-9,10-secoandrosta-1,3,5(10)-triene-9,17-dione monooxygenase reductase component